MSLVFCSSDARPLYIQDIMRVVALPPGADFQFRYQSRYASAEMQARIGSGDIIGADAVICFVGKVGTPDAYIVPVRAAKITAVRQLGDAFVIRFSAGGFPGISTFPRDRAGIEGRGKSLLDHLKSEHHDSYFAAWGRGLEEYTRNVGRSHDAWSAIVERLGVLETFDGSYFLRTSIFSGGHEVAPQVSDTGESWFAVTGGRDLVLRAWFSAEDPNFEGRRLAMQCDEQLLYPTSDKEYSLSSRYDEVNFWLSARGAEVVRRTLLTVSLTDATQRGVSTSISLRVRVDTSRTKRAFQATAAGLSAAAVATPAILGSGTYLGYRLVIGAAGALGLAWVSRGR